jgi:hypothetical protein
MWQPRDPINHTNGAVFMSLGHPSSDVDFPTRTAKQVSIFNHHHWQNKGFWIHSKASHGGWKGGSRDGERKHRGGRGGVFKGGSGEGGVSSVGEMWFKPLSPRGCMASHLSHQRAAQGRQRQNSS